MKIRILNAGTHEAQVSPLSGLKGRGEARTIVISIISFISNASFDFFFLCVAKWRPFFTSEIVA